MFSKKQRLYFLYFSVDWETRTWYDSKSVAGVDGCFSLHGHKIRIQTKKLLGNVQEPYSRRSNTLRRSFRRTETKSGVVSGESQKMSAEGAMHSCCAESLRQKDRVRRSTKTGSCGFYFFRTMLPGREDGFFHGKNGERLAEKET